MKKEKVGNLDTDTHKTQTNTEGKWLCDMEAETEIKLLPTKEYLWLLVAGRVKEGSPTQKLWKKHCPVNILIFKFILQDSVDHNKPWKILRDRNTRPPYLPPEKPLCRPRSNSQNQTQNNGLVQNWERSMLMLYIVTLFI